MLSNATYTLIGISVYVAILIATYLICTYALNKSKAIYDKILLTSVSKPRQTTFSSNKKIITTLNQYMLKEKQKFMDHPYRILLQRTFRDFNILCWLPCGKVSIYNLIEPSYFYRFLLIVECIAMEWLVTVISSIILPYSSTSNSSIQLFVDALIRAVILAFFLQLLILPYLTLINYFYLRQIRFSFIFGKTIKEQIDLEQQNPNDKSESIDPIASTSRIRLLSEDKRSDGKDPFIKKVDADDTESLARSPLAYAMFLRARSKITPLSFIHNVYVGAIFLTYLGILITRGTSVNYFSMIVVGITFFLDFGFFRVILCFILATIKYLLRRKKPVTSYTLKKNEALKQEQSALEANNTDNRPNKDESEIKLDTEQKGNITATGGKDISKIYEKSFDVSNLNLLPEPNGPLRKTEGSRFKLGLGNATSKIDVQREQISDSMPIFPHSEMYNHFILRDLMNKFNPVELSRMIKDWSVKKDLPTIEEIEEEYKIQASNDQITNENLKPDEDSNKDKDDKENKDDIEEKEEENKNSNNSEFNPENVLPDQAIPESQEGSNGPNENGNEKENGNGKENENVSPNAHEMSFSKLPKPKNLLKNMENKGLLKSTIPEIDGLDLNENIENSESTPKHYHQEDLDQIAIANKKSERKKKELAKLKNMQNKGIAKRNSIVKIGNTDGNNGIKDDDLADNEDTPKHLAIRRKANNYDAVSEQEKPKKKLQQQVYELEKTLNDWSSIEGIGLKRKRRHKKQVNQLMRDSVISQGDVNRSTVENKTSSKVDAEYNNEHNVSQEIEDKNVKFDDNVVLTRRDLDEFNVKKHTFYRKDDLTNYSMGLGLNLVTRKEAKPFFSDYEDLEYNTVNEAAEEQSDTKNESNYKQEIQQNNAYNEKRLTNTDFKEKRIPHTKRNPQNLKAIKKSLPPLPKRGFVKENVSPLKKSSNPILKKDTLIPKQIEQTASPYEEKLVQRFKNYSPEVAIAKQPNEKEDLKNADVNKIYNQTLVKTKHKKKALLKRNRLQQEHNTFLDSDDDRRTNHNAPIENMMFFPVISPINHNSKMENAPSEKIESLDLP